MGSTGSHHAINRVPQTGTAGRIGAIVLLAALLVAVVALAIGLGLAPLGGDAGPGGQPATDNDSTGAVDDGPEDNSTDVVGETPVDAPNGDGDGAPTAADGDGRAGEVNTTLVERAIHGRINEIRTERTLSPLRYSRGLAEIAAYHSLDMAEEEYFSHAAPDGGTLADRYDRFGYDCRVRIDGGRYATGAENIAYTYAYARVQTGRGVVSYDGNETRIANGIVAGWMNSTGHRENILRSYWEREGLGVVLDDEDGRTQVIATQNFC